MNERANELIKSIPDLRYDASTGLFETDRRALYSLVELIVKECITIVDEQKECLHEEQKYWHDRDYGYEMAANDASKGIKQFFGVEE
jgi:hypothetical protein